MRTKKVQISGITAFLVVLNGCSLFHPYIDPPTIPIVSSPEAMPLLRTAIVEIQNTQETVRCKRNETQYFRVGLGLAAFGAAAGSAISGMYGASRDLILGLGLGAAGSYTGANLFFSDTKTKLYNAADVGLGCVADKAYAVSSAINSLEIEIQIIEKSKPKNCTTGPYENAITNLNLFIAQDATMTQKVRAAGRRIIVKLNEELEKNEPTLESILNAAKEIGPLANTFAQKKGSESGAESEEEKDVSCTIHEEQLNEFAKRIDNVINSSSDQFSTINSCNSTLSPILPLTASQTEINIGKDEDVMIQFSGGKEPFLLEPKWVSSIPATDQIQVKRMGPREIMVSGKSNIPLAPNNFKFNVSDTAVIPNTLEIIIKSK